MTDKKLPDYGKPYPEDSHQPRKNRDIASENISKFLDWMIGTWRGRITGVAMSGVVLTGYVALDKYQHRQEEMELAAIEGVDVKDEVLENKNIQLTFPSHKPFTSFQVRKAISDALLKYQITSAKRINYQNIDGTWQYGNKKNYFSPFTQTKACILEFNEE